MKMKTIGMFALAVLLVPTVACAAGVTVSPDTYSVSLVGGESVNRTIEVSWSGDLLQVAELETEITSPLGVNGSEIWVNYSKNPIIVGEKEVTLTINTAPDIKPGNYTLETECEVVRDVKTKTETDTDVIYKTKYRNRTIVENQTVVKNRTVIRNVTNETLREELEEKRNRTKWLEEKNKNLTERVNKLESDLESITGKYILGVLIVVLGGIIFYKICQLEGRL